MLKWTDQNSIKDSQMEETQNLGGCTYIRMFQNEFLHFILLVLEWDMYHDMLEGVREQFWATDCILYISLV